MPLAKTIAAQVPQNESSATLRPLHQSSHLRPSATQNLYKWSITMAPARDNHKSQPITTWHNSVVLKNFWSFPTAKRQNAIYPSKSMPRETARTPVSAKMFVAFSEGNDPLASNNPCHCFSLEMISNRVHWKQSLQVFHKISLEHKSASSKPFFLTSKLGSRFGSGSWPLLFVFGLGSHFGFCFENAWIGFAIGTDLG